MKKLVLLTSALVAALLLGASPTQAQILFNTGTDSFNLDYVPNASGRAHDVLTTVVASGTGLSSLLTGTDLSSYATLTGGAEAVSYEDHSTGTTIPNYGDGTSGAPSSATASELFTFTANSGKFASLTFNPGSYLQLGGTVTLTYSINGGSTFMADPNGLGAFTITPGTNSVEVLETEHLTNTSYSAISNRAGGPDLTGNNFALSVNAIVVPEPSTYALMLGGLATLFFFARRRSNA